jgi:thiol:disulfide interchange protein
MALRFPSLQPLLVLAALALVPAAGLRADPEYPKMGADIYDTKADATADIAAALAKAGTEHKRVLLVFGANWCIWCHRLHNTFESNAAVAEALGQGFVLVDVDVNTRKGEKRNAAVNERYGNPIQHGIPVLVVLDAGGKQLTTKDSGELEEGDGHSPAKILAFLSTWAPPAHP